MPDQTVSIAITVDGKQAVSAINMTDDSFKKMSKSIKQADAGLKQTTSQTTGHLNNMQKQAGGTTMAMMGLNYTLRDSPYLFQNLNMGIMAISNNIGPMLDGFMQMKREAGSNKSFIKNLTGALTGPAGLSIALSLVVAGIQAFSFISAKASRESKGLGDSAENTAMKIEEMEQALHDFTVTAKRAKEIDLELKTDKYQAQLDEAKSSLRIWENQLYDNTLAAGKALVKIEEIEAEMERLQGIISDITPEYEKYKKQLEDINTAAMTLSEDGLKELVSANGINTNALEVSLSKMREHLKTLPLMDAAYADSAAAVQKLEKVLKDLTKASEKENDELNKKKQAALIEQLAIDKLREGRERDLADLEKWYRDKYEIASGNEQALILLDQVYKQKQAAINESYRQSEVDKQRSYQEQLNQISDERLRLEGANESDLLRLKKDRLQEEYNAEQLGTERSKQLALDLQSVEIDIEKAKRSEAQKTASFNEQMSRYELDINIRKKEALGATEQEIMMMKLAYLQQQNAAIDTSSDEGRLKVAKNNQQILDLEIELANARIAEEQRVENAKIQSGQYVFNQLNSLLTQYYNNERQKDQESIDREYDKKQAALDREREEELSHAYTSRQKDRINRDYDNKEEELEEERQRAEKEAASKGFEIEQTFKAAEALMATYKAATTALEAGPFLGPIMAGIITAMGLANVAAIESQEPPGFASGGLFVGDGGATDDKNLVKLSNREYVVNNAMTEKHFSLVDDTNNDRVVYGSDGIVGELRALRSDVRDVKKETAKLSGRPINAVAKIDKYETAAIYEKGNYEVTKNRL